MEDGNELLVVVSIIVVVDGIVTVTKVVGSTDGIVAIVVADSVLEIEIAALLVVVEVIPEVKVTGTVLLGNWDVIVELWTVVSVDNPEFVGIVVLVASTVVLILEASVEGVLLDDVLVESGLTVVTVELKVEL